MRQRTSPLEVQTRTRFIDLPSNRSSVTRIIVVCTLVCDAQNNRLCCFIKIIVIGVILEV
jgi:hypothetical protein